MSLVFQRLSQSVVLRITSIMLSVILTAFISIFSSIYMSQISEFDGKTINLSGSLRMMSYRITTQVVAMQDNPTEENKEKVRQLIERFETLFNDPVLKRDFMRFTEVRLEQDYLDVKSQWEGYIRPTLLNAEHRFDLQSFLPKLDAYVNSINTLVYGYQSVLEEKLTQLKIIQSTTLAITLLLILLSIYSIHRHIARPLRELTSVAEASSNGDWTIRSSVQRDDELGLLSKTLNKANESIQATHQHQEQLIQEKTQELSRNNEILTFLYDVAQQVNESHSGQLDFEQILHELRAVSALQRVEIKLFSTKRRYPYQHVVVQDNATAAPAFSAEQFGIEKNGINYGEIIVYPANTPELERWQSDLIHSTVDQLAMALSLSYHLNQQRRIALLDERAIIARELHDSLAQSLSYLKIQVTRIERGMVEQNIAADAITKPVSELKEGLISAYRQLRELLTTFRLQIGSEGLQSAMAETINTLSQRSEMKIELQYACTHIPFQPNEEIHLLQITKEALQNAINHSKGSKITIKLFEQGDKSIVLSVRDNGIGIQQQDRKLNHYGTEIMQERCRSLNGELHILAVETGGTEVNLRFPPLYLDNSHEDLSLT